MVHYTELLDLSTEIDMFLVSKKTIELIELENLKKIPLDAAMVLA